MTQPVFRTHKEARDAGWFSRRHETFEANAEARTKYHAKTRPAARIERARRRSEQEREG